MTVSDESSPRANVGWEVPKPRQAANPEKAGWEVAVPRAKQQPRPKQLTKVEGRLEAPRERDFLEDFKEHLDKVRI